LGERKPQESQNRLLSPSYRKSNHIGEVMVSVLASSEVDRGLELRSGQTKDNSIGSCCFSAKHVALIIYIRRKSKAWWVRSQDNVSEWGDMTIRGAVVSES
jgi:uncharacterized protein YaeQ